MSLDVVIQTGSYTGNDATQSVAIGWQPALVLTFIDKGGGPANRAIGIKTPEMAGDDAMMCSSAAVFLTTNGLTLTSTGFDVGSDTRINSSGDTVYWMAIREGSWLDTGSYTGDDPTDVDVALGRQPGFLFVSQVTATIAQLFKMTGQASDVCAEFVTAVADVNALALQSTGFQATNEANDVGETFDYVALYTLPGSTRHLQSGSYTGDGSAPLAIALGRQPKAVFIHDESGTGEIGFKTETMSSADFAALSTAYAMNTTGNGITITSTGFTVGSIFDVGSEVYNWVAFFD